MTLIEVAKIVTAEAVVFTTLYAYARSAWDWRDSK